MGMVKIGDIVDWVCSLGGVVGCVLFYYLLVSLVVGIEQSIMFFVIVWLVLIFMIVLLWCKLLWEWLVYLVVVMVVIMFVGQYDCFSVYIDVGFVVFNVFEVVVCVLVG